MINSPSSFQMNGAINTPSSSSKGDLKVDIPSYNLRHILLIKKEK